MMVCDFLTAKNDQGTKVARRGSLSWKWSRNRQREVDSVDGPSNGGEGIKARTFEGNEGLGFISLLMTWQRA